MSQWTACAQRQRKLSGPRNAARGRLDGCEAAIMRGNTDAASGIGAKAERRTAGGNDRGLATAAAARRTREIIGIIRPPVDQIVSLVRASEFGHIGLAEDDAA